MCLYFTLFCYCFPWERVVYYLDETSVILFCYCCFLVLSALWLLSLALYVCHLALFLLFYLSLDCYYHCFLVFFVPHIQLVYPYIFPFLHQTCQLWKFQNWHKSKIVFFTFSLKHCISKKQTNKQTNKTKQKQKQNKTKKPKQNNNKKTNKKAHRLQLVHKWGHLRLLNLKVSCCFTFKG